ncbi:hypothetical protein IAR55_003850 [Kwoniella newhampshirensis]|uniref:mRNA export factor MEX67 n=1 Tax=Kwoniella newhampshirensis TaxID=1651941 RepID=A0AAW0YYC2_9TREE
MAAFQQALANFNSSKNTEQNGPTASGSSLSIRGTANGAPSARGLATALRGAGISREQQMELDGTSGGKIGRGAGRRTGGRSGGPLDQTGRHHPPNNNSNNSKPYQKPLTAANLAARMSSGSSTGRGGRPAPRNGGHPGRQPAGTPPTIQQLRVPNKAERDHAKSELNKKLHSDEMKAWLRSKMISEGVLDMSGLVDDPWLKENGILPPGHPNAPTSAGLVFWRLIDEVFQKAASITIHTLSLANNNLDHLRQLEKLPMWLPHIRALDLSRNPIRSFNELDNIRAAGEKKGKANAGAGSLKSLIELKLNDCQFREKTLQQPDGPAVYKHEILRRFPGLRILDGVSLERVIFPIDRKPKVRETEAEKAALVAKPFTFPFDVQPFFFEQDAARQFAMEFCAKFFALFDNDRNATLIGYAPDALISISANTLPSRSFLQQDVQKTRSNRPQPVSFEAWTNLPSRNFLRNVSSIKQRMDTLQFASDPERLLRWWNKNVPKTRHPLEDAKKWCIESWVLDGEGVDVRLCLMVQGEFEEMPSGTYRSFSRTFILVDAPQGSPARNAGWPALVLSDTMIVHSYLGTGAFDDNRSLAVHGVAIQPPASVAPATAAPVSDIPQAQQEALLAQLSQRTGMNAQFSGMCLAQNGWDFEAAVKNYEEIKTSIPAEAYQ